ncbi:MAG: hypothetical protein ACTTH7_04010 [Treponema sp.]
MKHVSRIVFGLSIAAVLALFTACQQANDAKKAANSQGSTIPEALTNGQAQKGDNAQEVKLSATGVAVTDYESVKITAKEAGKGEDVVIGDGSDKAYTAQKDAFETAIKKGVALKMPKANTSYTFTVELIKQSKTVAKSSVTGSSKEENSQGTTIPEALTSGQAQKGDNAQEVKLSATGVAVTDYESVKITAKEAGKGEDVVIGDGSDKAYTAQKDAFETAIKKGVALKMPKANTSYTFTVELIKQSKTVAKSSVTGSSKEN